MPARPRFGLIGYPLEHSFSPAYFAGKFAALGLPFTYERFPCPDGPALEAFLNNLREPAGLNVTIPHKVNVLPWLDELSPVAGHVGAVNTITQHADGRRRGDNTDVAGVQASLRTLLPAEARLARALVLGTGGASRAVAAGLRQAFPNVELVYASRQPAGPETLAYDDPQLPALLASTPLVVNTTPLGTWPNTSERPSLPYEAIGPGHCLMDLVYNPPETAFLAAGRARGARGLNGLPMLHGQAEASWAIWSEAFGIRA